LPRFGVTFRVTSLKEGERPLLSQSRWWIRLSVEVARARRRCRSFDAGLRIDKDRRALKRCWDRRRVRRTGAAHRASSPGHPLCAPCRPIEPHGHGRRGRTSGEELQDPTISIPRQLQNCRRALPPNAVIVAFFWDIESGRKEIDDRGTGAHEKFEIAVPRDGGLPELLAEAKRKDRRFDAVTARASTASPGSCTSGRRWSTSSTAWGVPLFAADEGVETTRRKSTKILVRRTKQMLGRVVRAPASRTLGGRLLRAHPARLEHRSPSLRLHRGAGTPPGPGQARAGHEQDAARAGPGRSRRSRTRSSSGGSPRGWHTGRSQIA
jgi:hypothetical protein